MSLGEIPGGNVRAYYKLSNTTDSGPNGYTLTNNNSVAFNPAKIGTGADFGTSGTNKGLTYGSNPFSSTTPDNVAFLFLYKLNDTANTGVRVFFEATSKTSATDGRLYRCAYTISSGTVTVTARRRLAASNLEISVTHSANTTDWYTVWMVYNSSISRFVLSVLNMTDNTSVTQTNTSASTGGSLTTSATVFLSIGNLRALNGQAYAIMDQFIIAESLYTYDSIETEPDTTRYYTQLKGRFCI